MALYTEGAIEIHLPCQLQDPPPNEWSENTMVFELYFF